MHAVEEGLLSARARGLGPGGAAEGCRVQGRISRRRRREEEEGG